MAIFQITITMPRRYRKHLLFDFTITNISGEDYYILKRNTPLEGLKSDCLEVTIEGKKIMYDGYFFKRASPLPGEYLLLKAGKSFTKKSLNLSAVYDVSTQGVYQVTFNESKLIIKKAGHIQAMVANTSPALISANSNSIYFEHHGDGLVQTIGTAARNKREENVMSSNILNTAEAMKNAKKAVCKNGTPKRKKLVEKVHKYAYEYAKKSISSVADNKNYKRWFGKHTKTNSKRVKDNYKKIKTGMEDIEFVYDLSGRGCGKGDYAYTTVGGNKIWLCNYFWSSSDKGHDSKTGTLIHEHSHASAGTDDFEYAEADCEKLAKMNAVKATKNADNYEFFAEVITTL